MLLGSRVVKARLIAFGEIEVQGERYDYDVVIDGGQVRKRKKVLPSNIESRAGTRHCRWARTYRGEAANSSWALASMADFLL